MLIPNAVRLVFLMVLGILLLLGTLGWSAWRHAQKADPLLTMWPPMYWFFVSLFRISFRLAGRFTIIGRENLPSSGGYLVAANHVSYVDPPVVGSALTRFAYFMAKTELFEAGIFGKAIPWVGAYPVKRGAPDRGAVKRTLELLKAGEVVVIFPEGTRKPVGEPGEAESGFGWVALKTDAPIIPVGVEGSDRLFPRGAKFIRRADVTVRIGPPVPMTDLRQSSDTRAAMREAGQRTMSVIKSLIAPAA